MSNSYMVEYQSDITYLVITKIAEVIRTCPLVKKRIISPF
jgi:hypothetical protein